jgi:aspartate racemase
MTLPTIGILGGMGPEATILLQQRLIAAVAAQDDADHIPLLVDMNPQVPSRLAWLLDHTGTDPGPVLAGMARRLQRAGAAALAMPCNTAHHFAPQIAAAVGIPLMHMPQLAAKQIAGQHGSGTKVGILASPATQKTNLFHDALHSRNCDAVYPADQSGLLEAIRRIKAQGPCPMSAAALQDGAETLVDDGCECLIIGCSEFSIIADRLRAPVPVIDTLDVLVDHIVAFAGATRRTDQPQLAEEQFIL